MRRVSTLDAQILRRLVLEPNLDQLLSLLTALTKMSAQPTLSILNLRHANEPFRI